MPASPSRPPDRPPLERPGTRQIWTRSLILGAVLALFIAIAFGRFEGDRILSLFILWVVPLVLVLGGLFMWLNRPGGGTSGGR